MKVHLINQDDSATQAKNLADSNALKHAELFIHSHEVEVVPGFDDLAVTDPHDRYAGEVDWRVSSGDA